jgi:Cdc6-like AAA superfamily ATPase
MSPEVIIVIVLVLIFIVITITRLARVVPLEKRLVIHRFGHFHRLVGPGPVQVIPGLDQVVQIIEVRNHPVEITVPGILAFGIPNELTLNFWYKLDPAQVAGKDRDKLAEILQITNAERNHQIEVKFRQAVHSQVADLQKIMPLPDNASALAGVGALAPGMPRYNKLLEGIKQQLKKTLPSLGIVLNTTHPIVLTRRSISDDIIEAIKRRRGREIDSEWLTNYANELRNRFPDMSDGVLTQILASIETVDAEQVQRLHVEGDTGAEVEYEMTKDSSEPHIIAKPKPRKPQAVSHRSGAESVQKPHVKENIVPHFQNPYIAGPPIVDPKMFFGRQSDLKKIIGLLTNNFVMLTGSRRIGKTSLLYQLKFHLPKLKDTSSKFIPVLISVEGTPENEFFHTLMEDIVNTLQKYLPAKFTTKLAFDQSNIHYSARVFSRELQSILKSLENTSPEPSQLVLLLDEMDILNTYSLETQSQLRRIFQRFTNRNLSVVVAGVKLHRHWAGESSPFYNMFLPVTLTSFSEAEAHHLITKPVEGTYSYSDEAVTRILEATLGMPHRIQQLCLQTIHYLQTASEGRTKGVPG